MRSVKIKILVLATLLGLTSLAACAATCEVNIGSSSKPLTDFFTAEINECSIDIQEGDTSDKIVMSGTLIAISQTEVENLTVEGFVTIGDGPAEPLGTAKLEKRSFNEGEAWNFTITGSKEIEGLAPFSCNIEINGKIS